jgi:poly-gamma-glutamate synthesis protein (capsule biosynthesis protein)
MGHSPQIESAWNRDAGCYIYDSCFAFVNQTLNQLTWPSNLELTLPSTLYGIPAIQQSRCACSALKIPVLIYFVRLITTQRSWVRRPGTNTQCSRLSEALIYRHFSESAERDSVYPLLIEAKGIHLALLNYSYSTNGMPFPSPGIVNMIDTGLIRKDMKEPN